MGSPRPTVLLACLVALAAGVPAHGDGANLLANPGAEEGTDPVLEEGQLPPPRGWAASGELTVGDYGATEMPPASASQEIGGGAKLFVGGRCAGAPLCSPGSAQQEFDVSANAGAIDSGSVRAQLAAAIGGRAADTDAGRVRLQFLGAGSEQLGVLELGPVTPADRGNQTRLLARSGERVVPAGTRRLRVALLADGGDGERIDAYFDNVSLQLTGASQPPVNVTPPAPGTATPGGGDERGESGTGGGSAALSLSSRPVRMTRSGTIVVRARCARAGAPCAGRMTLAAGRRRCASRAATVAPSRTRRLTLRLTRACRALVASRARGLATTLTFRLADGEAARARIVVRRPA